MFRRSGRIPEVGQVRQVGRVGQVGQAGWYAECQSTTIKPAGLPAQKTPQTGVLEYSQSDRSDVSDRSDGRAGMQSATRQQ